MMQWPWRVIFTFGGGDSFSSGRPKQTIHHVVAALKLSQWRAVTRGIFLQISPLISKNSWAVTPWILWLPNLHTAQELGNVFTGIWDLGPWEGWSEGHSDSHGVWSLTPGPRGSWKMHPCSLADALWHHYCRWGSWSCMERSPCEPAHALGVVGQGMVTGAVQSS